MRVALFVLLGLISQSFFHLRAEDLAGLPERASLSSQGALDPSLANAKELAASAFEGFSSPCLALASPGGKSQPLQKSTQGAAAAQRTVPTPSLAQRRAEIREKRQSQERLRSLRYGLMGFLAGALLGAVLGGVLAGGLVVKSSNPKWRYGKWALLAPAVAVGAVVGQLAFPFVLARFFSKAQPYD